MESDELGRFLTGHATPEQSRSVSALWAGIVSAFRKFFPLACRHEWVDSYVFASCIISTSRGDSRPRTYQVMRYCEKCDNTWRRQLTRNEWFAWREELLEAWEDGEGGVDFDWLEENFPPSVKE